MIKNDLSDRSLARKLSGWNSVVEERLAIYEKLLLRWQKLINLVAPSTYPHLWVRHFSDSWQIIQFSPSNYRNWVDLGSGGGFPGVIAGIHASVSGLGPVHLIESDHRKCAFLRDVSRETGANTIIHRGRIEQVLPDLAKEVPVDVISARALAPIATLMDWTAPIIEAGACGLFQKGREVSGELNGLEGDNRFIVKLENSVTSEGAKLIILRSSKGVTCALSS